MTMTYEEKEAQRQEREQQIMADIDEMDNSLDPGLRSDGPVEETLSDEVPIDEHEDRVVAEAGPDDLIEEVKREAEKAEAEAKEKPAEETPSDEYDFTAFINEMARQALGKAPVAPTPVPTPTPPVAPPVEAPPIVQTPAVPIDTLPSDLLTVEEMDQAFNSPQKMVELFQKVYMRAKVDAIQQSLTMLPNVIRPALAQETALHEMVSTFYKENPELNEYRDFVQYCATQVENAHPDWSPKQVMSETAKVAKGRLPSLREAHQRERKVKPSFVDQKVSSNKPSSKQMSRLEQELAAMPDY